MTSQRLRKIFSGIYILLACLAVRLFYIQIYKGLDYSELAEKQFVKKIKKESLRGEVFDRNGRCLATSLESQSVFIRPKEVDRPGELVRLLQTSLSLDPRDLRQKLGSGRDFFWLERKLSPLQARMIEEKKLRGLGVQSEQKRYYPDGSLACHIVGSVGMDNHGLSGIEQALDSFLTGKMLVVDQLRDGKGRSLLTDVRSSSALAGGAESSKSNSVALTIDRSLQYVAEREIQRGVEENRAKSGMILIQNPKTGEILAMAAYPNFDPNELSKGALPKRFDMARIQNPMVGRVFEPGSTFKIVAFSAALEEKTFSTNDVLHCENGKWKFLDVTINDHEPSADLTLPQVMERSSNIGTAKIGLKLGKDVFFRYARAFGFGNKTGLLLPGESEGLLKDPKEWSKVSLPILAFGQGLGVTAVQMIGAFSAIANGGILMEPMILKRDVMAE